MILIYHAFFLVIEYFTDKSHQYFNEGKNEDEEEPEADKKNKK